MKWLFVALGFCFTLVQPQAMAQASGDALSWLGRMAAAGQRLNYSGTFIYQSGKSIETSRVVHMMDAAGEH